MINITFEQAAAYYVLFFVTLFVGVEIFSKAKKDVSEYKEIKLWQCSICTFVYSSIFEEKMTVCPRCGSYNKKEADEQ
jgi:rubrerythrin